MHSEANEAAEEDEEEEGGAGPSGSVSGSVLGLLREGANKTNIPETKEEEREEGEAWEQGVKGRDYWLSIGYLLASGGVSHFTSSLAVVETEEGGEGRGTYPPSDSRSLSLSMCFFCFFLPNTLNWG